jgi:phospholipid-transporting ATPase
MSFNTPETLANLKGETHCEQPNISLVSWVVNLVIPGKDKISIGMNQALFRGCILKNTERIYG